MYPVEATWGDVRPAMFVQGRDGGIWRVAGIRSTATLDTRIADAKYEVAVTSPAGQLARFLTGWFDPVTVMVPNWDEPHLVAALDGIKYRRINAWTFSKNTPQSRFEVATHMLLMHRMSIKPHSHKENGPLANLLKMHALDHAAPSRGWSPHIHVPAR